jgi:hypothetical protein
MPGSFRFGNRNGVIVWLLFIRSTIAAGDADFRLWVCQRHNPLSTYLEIRLEGASRTWV